MDGDGGCRCRVVCKGKKTAQLDGRCRCCSCLCLCVCWSLVLLILQQSRMKLIKAAHFHAINGRAWVVISLTQTPGGGLQIRSVDAFRGAPGRARIQVRRVIILGTTRSIAKLSCKDRHHSSIGGCSGVVPLGPLVTLIQNHVTDQGKTCRHNQDQFHVRLQALPMLDPPVITSGHLKCVSSLLRPTHRSPFHPRVSPALGTAVLVLTPPVLEQAVRALLRGSGARRRLWHSGARRGPVSGEPEPPSWPINATPRRPPADHLAKPNSRPEHASLPWLEAECGNVGTDGGRTLSSTEAPSIGVLSYLLH